MANTSSRTLRLLSLLQNHRFWPGTELADRLDVSPRTLRRDIERLRELGYPVDAQRGVAGGYQLAAGAVLPPLLLDDDEAVALAVGLQSAVQTSTVAGIAESSVRALTKVIQVMPPRLRRRVDNLRTMTVPAGWVASGGGEAIEVDPSALTSIAQVCRDSERLQFTYADAGGSRTDREVEPHRLVSLGRRWYLVAFDLTRADWRSFRVDRIERPRGTAVRFRPGVLPAEDAAAFVRAGIDNLPTSQQVSVLVHAPAAGVRERIGRWATIEDLSDVRCHVHMVSDSLDWPMMALGVAGEDFEVVGPPELAERVRDWGDRFVRAAARSRDGSVTAATIPFGTKQDCDRQSGRPPAR